MAGIKIIVTGAQGQLGQEIVSMLQKHGKFEVYGLGKKELDITDLEQVKESISTIKPEIIIHAAAYTKVDLAEQKPELAFQINEIGTKNIVSSAAELQAKLVYISTDYVFNGDTDTPYNEWDQTDPIGIYGKTKLAGEKIVSEALTKFFIVRTSWVYGENGDNFVKNMLRLSKEKKVIRVVNDQTGTPTYTLDLANAILSLIESDKYGIYHITNSGSCTWYEFAEAIFEEANVSVNLYPCLTKEFPSLAQRPKYSVLNHTVLTSNGFPVMRHWREALQSFVKKVQKTETCR